MGTITGLTAERMLEIEAASIVDGDVVGDNLFLSKHDGTLVNAGSVRGPIGPTGPMGSALAVVSGIAVPDVGVTAQIRAGRQLAAADFTNLGLSAPLGLWNLGSTADVSGNSRTLTNKGTVPFGVGINGSAASAAVFSGSTGQAFYIPDSGAADSFRLRVGSWGCWVRTAKRGVQQYLLNKIGAAGTYAWALQIDASNHAMGWISNTGSNVLGNPGTQDVCDDRWHFIVATFDGTILQLYVDGIVDAVFIMQSVVPFVSSAPLNIGGAGADSVTATASPHYGRIDEAFVSAEVLSEEQVRNLYAASIPHALGVAPTTPRISIRRRKRGAVLAPGAFPSQPLRLYNFVNGGLTDEGSANVPVASAGGGGSLSGVAGADGVKDHAYNFQGAHAGLGSSDAGLPSGLTVRSYGAWFKSYQSTTVPCIMGWGSGASSGAGSVMGLTSGVLYAQTVGTVLNGLFVADGKWHFGVVVEDNSAADGLKQKIYVDGRLVASSTVLNSVVLSGAANRFRIGNYPDGSAGPLNGQVHSVFVHTSALTAEQIRSLYNLGSQALPASPRSPENHIETMEAGRILAVFDSIEPSDLLDLVVMA